MDDIAADRRAANDKRVADDVQKFGCHVISVFDPEEKHPLFTYSIGIYECSKAPEAIVIGLKASLGSYIVNEYNRRVRTGEVFRRGILYEGFLEGFAVYVEPAKSAVVAAYSFGWAASNLKCNTHQRKVCTWIRRRCTTIFNPRTG